MPTQRFSPGLRICLKTHPDIYFPLVPRYDVKPNWRMILTAPVNEWQEFDTELVELYNHATFPVQSIQILLNSGS